MGLTQLVGTENTVVTAITFHHFDYIFTHEY